MDVPWGSFPGFLCHRDKGQTVCVLNFNSCCLPGGRWLMIDSELLGVDLKAFLA